VNGIVWLVGARPADDEVAREIQAALADGPRPFDELVEDVADRLIDRDCALSGGVPEVALLGARLLPARVAQAVAAMDGDVLRVAGGAPADRDRR
jgi:hypothetical protein